MQVDSDTLDVFILSASGEPCSFYFFLSKVMGWLVFTLAVNDLELIGIAVEFNHVYNIFSLFYLVEVCDYIDFGEVLDWSCGFKFFDFFIDFEHKGLVVVLGVFVDLDGVDDAVEAALAVEETEGLVDIDSIDSLFVGHELFKEDIAAGVTLEDEFIISHYLQLVDSVEVVLTCHIHRYHFDIRHIQVECLSYSWDQVLIVYLSLH